MAFRVERVDDPAGQVTGALVFDPAPALPPGGPRILVERFGRESNILGAHGWTVSSPGLPARRTEWRGGALWVFFGAELSHWVLPETPVRLQLLGPGAEVLAEGTDIWPPIPRGAAPPAPEVPQPAPPPPALPAPPVPAPPAPQSPAPATPAPTSPVPEAQVPLPSPWPPRVAPARSVPQAGNAAPPVPVTAGAAAGRETTNRPALLLALVLLIGAGAWWWHDRRTSSAEPSPAEAPLAGAPGPVPPPAAPPIALPLPPPAAPRPPPPAQAAAPPLPAPRAATAPPTAGARPPLPAAPQTPAPQPPAPPAGPPGVSPANPPSNPPWAQASRPSPLQPAGPATKDASPSAPVPGEAFLRGQADRRRMEAWVGQQPPDIRRGIDSWADRRNRPSPGDCVHPDPIFVAGCEEARRRFAPIDAQRRSDPDYWRGWNSF